MAVRALILDDSTTVRGLLARILGALGFESVQAANGLEGLAAFDREGTDIGLVLADWNMPKMNGLDFVKRLRARSEFRLVPVIMVTTETDVAYMVEALSAGANEYLMKPFTAEMLEAKLRILQVASS